MDEGEGEGKRKRRGRYGRKREGIYREIEMSYERQVTEGGGI